MGKLDIHRQNALKSIQMAGYMMHTTYPLLKEPKTLLIISDHILSSLMSSVSQLLCGERSKRKIPPFHETNESKLNSFRNYVVNKYSLKEYLDIIEKIMGIQNDRKEAVMEFSRDNKYVIATDQFRKLDTISEEDVKNYIKKAKEFIIKVDELTINE